MSCCDAGIDPDNDCYYVAIAAVPAPRRRSEDGDLDELTRRAGWAQIVERRDVLASAVSGVVLARDGGQSWPSGRRQSSILLPACPPTERTARLPRAHQPPTVWERRLLQHILSVDQGELLHDDTSGCAAVAAPTIRPS